MANIVKWASFLTMNVTVLRVSASSGILKSFITKSTITPLTAEDSSPSCPENTNKATNVIVTIAAEIIKGSLLLNLESVFKILSP